MKPPMSGPTTLANPPDAGQVSDVAPALARRDDVADDREGQRHHAAGPQPLHAAERDELDHALRQTRQQRAEQEDQDRGEEHRPPAVDVAQLAVERRADGRAQQVGRDDPRVVVEAAELPTIVGSAVATIVWSRAARNRLVIRPLKTMRICRCVNVWACGRSSHGSYRAWTRVDALGEHRRPARIGEPRVPGAARSLGRERSALGSTRARDPLRHRLLHSLAQYDVARPPSRPGGGRGGCGADP